MTALQIEFVTKAAPGYQVREGLITRDQALALAAEDNRPHLEELDDFAKHTGFNLEEVLTKINSIDTLY